MADGYISQITLPNNETYLLKAASATILQTQRTIWGQTFDGSANITGHFTMGNTSSRYHYFYIKQHNTDNTVGYLMYDSGNSINVTSGRWRFAEYSPNSTNNTTTTGKAEVYYLPIVDTGLTKDTAYNILTTKSAVTIAQGGTGKTTAAEAWTALGGGASGKHDDSYFVLAPSDTTDNAIVRFNGTSGQIQNSGATIDENGNITATSFVGDVTGNVSGSSGSCTGNAATASALASSVSLWGNSFNGSADINDNIIFKHNTARGTAPTDSNNYNSILFSDSTGATTTLLGMIANIYNTSNQSVLELLTLRPITDTNTYRGIRIYAFNDKAQGEVRVDINTQLQVLNTTNATTTSNGALRVDGGISVANDIYMGGKLTIANTVTLQYNTTDDALEFVFA